MCAFNVGVARGSIAFLLFAAGSAHAQYSTTFEPPVYSGSSSGVLITGQDGWYVPPVGGDPHSVFTYTGNPYGIVTNPQGGTQFDVGTFGTTFARAQHAVDFSAGGEWVASFDVLGLHTNPAGLGAEYLGSFSLQDSVVSRYFQQLMSWSGNFNAVQGPNGEVLNDYTTSKTHFHISLGIFLDTAPNTIAFRAPSMDFADLPVNNWYRMNFRWTFDAAAPKLLSASIQNLTAATPAVEVDLSSRNWYLAGGPSNTRPLPTDFRLFAGGSTGNLTAWDNISIAPATTGGCYANCDGSTIAPTLNVADFSCFLTKFAGGC